MPAFNSIDEVLRFLDDIPMFGKSGVKAINPGLDAITEFCERMGNPQNNFKSIHVAGTNGKGTTCHILEHVYRHSGFKTGLFTSPHLINYHERFRINGEEVEDERIITFFNLAEPILQDIQLSYFELSTAFAFWLFAEKKVEIAIIETGLGGRLDSTNILKPLISVITSISKDHEQVLGNTIEKIAFEKAGIIKQHTSVVIGNITGSAEQVIKEEASKKNSSLIFSSDLSPDFDRQIISLKAIEMSIETSFLEPVNAWNVAAAYCTVTALRKDFLINDENFKKALLSFKGLSARFERLSKEKKWFFSGSHNMESIDTMLEGLKHIPGEKTLVLSLMKDKANPDLLNQLAGFKHIFYYQMNMERAATINDLIPSLRARLIDDQSYQTILKEIDTEVVIFAGSFYFYAIVKRWVDQNNL